MKYSPQSVSKRFRLYLCDVLSHHEHVCDHVGVCAQRYVYVSYGHVSNGHASRHHDHDLSHGHVLLHVHGPYVVRHRLKNVLKEQFLLFFSVDFRLPKMFDRLMEIWS